MYKLLLLLILNLTEFLYVFATVTNDSENYLPLVVINRQNKLEFPNRIENATINPTLGFIGDAQFSKDESIDQMFFCPVNSTKQLDQIQEMNQLMQSTLSLKSIFRNIEVRENCLFKKNFKKDEALQCANEPKPTIYRVRKGDPTKDVLIINLQQCGPNNRGTRYEFGYEACISKTILQQIGDYIPPASQADFEVYKKNAPFQYERLPVYEICYYHDPDMGGHTIYTKHNLRSIDLLFDEKLEHEKEKKHTMMTDDYKNFKFDFRMLKGVYDRINPSMIANGTQEQSEGNSGKYLPEKLVSPDDMITAVLKKPTFHYINVKPMHEKLIELWKYMGDLVRENFRNMQSESDLQIYTGAFTLENLENYKYSQKYWPENEPQVWIKVIHEIKSDPDSSPTLVIIMKNEYQLEEKNSSDNNSDSALEMLCSVDHCEYFKQSKREIGRFSHSLKNVRCCPFNEIIDTFFNINLKHGNTLLPIVHLTYYNRG